MNKVEIKKEYSGPILALIGAIISYIAGIYYFIYGAQTEAALDEFGVTLEDFNYSITMFQNTAVATIILASLVLVGAILALKTNVALGGGILCIIIGIIVLYFGVIHPGTILELNPPLNEMPVVRNVGCMFIIDPLLMIIGGGLIIGYRKQL